MKPFLIHTHLGIDVKFWNDLFESHPQIQTVYSPEINNIYENANFHDIRPLSHKWQFANAYWYDILFYNHQVGYQNIYSDIKFIVIFGDILKIDLRKFGLIDKRFVQNYLSERLKRLKFISEKYKNCLVFEEKNFDKDDFFKKIQEFLCLKKSFNP